MTTRSGRLVDKAAIITGAAGGIGGAIAEAFCGRGSPGHRHGSGAARGDYPLAVGSHHAA